LDKAASLLLVVHHYMQRRSEHGCLDRPHFLPKGFQGLNDAARWRHLEDRPLDALGFQLGGASSGDEFSGTNEYDIVAVLRLVQKMSRHEDGDSFRGELVNQFPEGPARDGVDSAGRFVEEDNPG